MLGVVSGGDYISKTLKLEKLEVVDIFDYNFASELVQKEKTVQDIYEYIINYLEIPASQIIMVGDKIDQDIDIPKQVGITTVLAAMKYETLKGIDISHADFVIKDLVEILDIVK